MAGMHTYMYGDLYTEGTDSDSDWEVDALRTYPTDTDTDSEREACDTVVLAHPTVCMTTPSMTQYYSMWEREQKVLMQNPLNY